MWAKFARSLVHCFVGLLWLTGVWPVVGDNLGTWSCNNIHVEHSVDVEWCSVSFCHPCTGVFTQFNSNCTFIRRLLKSDFSQAPPTSMRAQTRQFSTIAWTVPVRCHHIVQVNYVLRYSHWVEVVDNTDHSLLDGCFKEGCLQSAIVARCRLL